MVINCKYTTIPFESSVLNIEDDRYSTGNHRLLAYIGSDKFIIKERMSWDEAKWELRGIVDAYERGEKIYEVK